MSDNVKGILYASTTAVLWGFLAIALKIALAGVDPYTIVWFRFLFSFVTLAIYFYFNYRPKLSILIKPPFLLIIAALFLGVNYMGFLLGLKFTTPNSAQVVMQIGPVILVLVGIFVFKEKLSRRQILGLFLTMAGLALFYREQVSSMASTDLFNIGMVWIFIGALSWVVYASLQKKLVRTFQPQQLNLLLFGLPALLYTPLAEPNSLNGMPSIFIAMLIFAGINTLLAYGAFAEALKYTDASKVSVIIVCNPIITILVMWFLNDFDIPWLEKDPISYEAFLYALLVLGGAAMTVFKRNRRNINRAADKQENI